MELYVLQPVLMNMHEEIRVRWLLFKVIGCVYLFEQTTDRTSIWKASTPQNKSPDVQYATDTTVHRTFIGHGAGCHSFREYSILQVHLKLHTSMLIMMSQDGRKARRPFEVSSIADLLLFSRYDVRT